MTLVLAALSLAACSGPAGNNNNNHGGNANVTLTVFDAPPAGADFVSFNVPITAVTLTPQTGADVSVFAPTSPAVFEMTRLQSDSDLLGTFQVPSGTYTAINVFVGTPFTVFVNSSAATIGSCAPSTICNLSSGAPGQITVTFSPALTITSTNNIGLGIEFNLNNAVTTQNGITIDFKQPNVVTVTTLPRLGQVSGTLDTIDDFTGTVTVVSGSSITIKSAVRGTLTASTTSTTNFHDPQALCTGATTLAACVVVNQTISVDATVSATGTVSITDLDFIDPATPAVDELEGVVFLTTTAGMYEMVVAEKVQNSTNALLTPVGSATQITFTLDPAVSFIADTRNLPINTITPVGFQDATDIFPGQVIMARVKANSVTQGTTLLNFVADRLLLRFTRTTGTVASVSGNAFTFSLPTMPAYFGFLVGPQAQTFVPQTIFDGAASISDLATNPSASIRALYLNPTKVPQAFQAEKVRKH